MSHDVALVDKISTIWQLEDSGTKFNEMADLAKGLGEADLPTIAGILRNSPNLRNPASDLAALVFVDLPYDEDGWDVRISDWLTSVRDPEDAFDAFEISSSAITWKLRKERPRLLASLTLSSVIRSKETGDPNFHTDLSILLQAARYDFNFHKIEKLLFVAGEETTNSSLYYRAMLQFSILGSGTTEFEENQHRQNLDEIQDIANQTQSEKILSLLLHGLWFTAGSDESSLMLNIGERLLSINPRNSITHMRIAAAYRRKSNYGEAIRSINTALALHSPLDVETHGDLKLERVTIANQQDADLSTLNANNLSMIVMRNEFEQGLETAQSRWNRKIDEFSEQATNDRRRLKQSQASFSSKLQAQMSDSLFKVVEMLGLFTALIALIASVVGANSVGGDIPWYARIAIIAVGGCITLGFFLLLRFIVRPDIDAMNSSDPDPIDDEEPTDV